MNLSQSQIKLVRALGQKKFRQKYQYFTAEGDKIVRDILTYRTYNIYQIYAVDQWIENHHTLLNDIDVPVFNISHKQLKQISFLKTPNDVMVVLRIPQEDENQINTSKGLHFYLDDIRDPGNMGTIIRIAVWFGFQSIIASESCVDFYNQKVVQATMGAFLHLPLRRYSADHLLLDNDLCLVTTSMSGQDIRKNTSLPEDAIIVIGNEGRGVSEMISEASTIEISIPSIGAHQDKIDSLNAAVSAGIVASYFAK